MDEFCWSCAGMGRETEVFELGGWDGYGGSGSLGGTQEWFCGYGCSSSLGGVQEWVEESRYSSYRWVGEVVLGMG